MKLSAEEIAEKRRQLHEELAKLDAMAEPDALPVLPARAETVRAVPGRSIRDLVLDALAEIGFMTYTQQLTLYIKARFGRDVSSTRFGTLSADEERAFRRGSSRAVWLGHGITSDRGEPVKRLWARSDWNFTERVVTPAFGRVQYLRAAARFAELAANADGFAADPDLLRFLAADLARDLGVNFRRGSFQLEEWKNIAEGQLAALPVAIETTSKIASHLKAQLNPAEQLFGRTSKPPVVADAHNFGKEA